MRGSPPPTFGHGLPSFLRRICGGPWPQFLLWRCLFTQFRATPGARPTSCRIPRSPATSGASLGGCTATPCSRQKGANCAWTSFGASIYPHRTGYRSSSRGDHHGSLPLARGPGLAAYPPVDRRANAIRTRISRPPTGTAEDPRPHTRVPGRGNLRLTTKSGEPVLFPKAPPRARAAMYLHEGRGRWRRSVIGRPCRTWRREIHRREAPSRFTGRTANAFRGQRRRGTLGEVQAARNRKQKNTAGCPSPGLFAWFRLRAGRREFLLRPRTRKREGTISPHRLSPCSRDRVQRGPGDLLRG